MGAMEALAITALVLSEALAIFLTWLDPLIEGIIAKVVAGAIWAVEGGVALWGGMSQGISLSDMAFGGAIAVSAVCIFTAGRPSVMLPGFLSDGENRKGDRVRRWIGVAGIIAGGLLWIVLFSPLS